MEELNFHCSLNFFHTHVSCYLTHYPMYSNISFILNQVFLLKSCTEVAFYPYTKKNYVICSAL